MEVNAESSEDLIELASLVYKCVKTCSARKIYHFDDETPFYFMEGAVPT